MNRPDLNRWPSPAASPWKQRYEAIRQLAVAGSLVLGVDPLGLVLLLRQGVAGWMNSWSGLIETTTQTPVCGIAAAGDSRFSVAATTHRTAGPNEFGSPAQRLRFMNAESKVTAAHLQRTAYLYIRQSTLRQVLENTESTQRQYALRQRALTLGWPEERIIVIDHDQGQSGASVVDREGFQRLVG